MSRSVTFNGITQFRPGGLTKIDANALAQIGLNPNGIIGLIGESEGGVPNVVTQIDDPALAVPTFRSGPLADAIRVAFDPSGDPRVPAGAFRVMAVRVNQGTQSTLTLYGLVPLVVGGPAFDTVAAGSDASHVHLTTGGLTVDAHIGNYIRVGTVEALITDNDASTITAALGSVPVLGTQVFILAPMFTYTSKDYGSHCNRIRQEVESGSTQGVAWSSSMDSNSQVSEDVGGRPYLDVEYIGQSSTVVLDTGTADGAGDINTIADSTKSWVTNAFQNLFAQVSGGGLAVANLRKISANGSATFDVTANFSAIPGIGATYAIRRGAIRTGTLVSATSTTATLEATINVAENELANMVLAITGGTGSGQKRVIASNTDGISSTLTLVQPFTTTPDATSTYSIRYVTKAVGSFTGAAGVTTGFNTVVSANGVTAATELNLTFTQGQTIQDLVNIINANSNYMAYVSPGRNGLELINDFDFDHGAANVELRTDRNQQTASPFPVFDYSAVAGTGDSIAALGGLARLTDSAGAFTASMVGQNITLSTTWAANNQGHFPIVGVASATVLYFVNPLAVTETAAGVYSIAAQVSQTWNNHFRKDLRDLLADINSVNEYVTVARATGTSLGAGTGLPEFTGAGVGSKAIVGDYYKTMSGGSRGTSTNTNWQSAFDALLAVRKSSVVPCMSEDQSALGYGSTATIASVAAQLLSHVTLCRGIEKNECGGYLGFKGTKTQYIAMLNAMNDMDVQVTSQFFTFLNAAGTSTQMDPWASAVAAAGMRAGMPEVGEPLTHKYLKTSGVTQDLTWDPSERTDANLLIQNGALFAEYKEGKGIRWVRDLTSFIQNDNLAYAEGSVRDVVRYVSYGLRTNLEDTFTGIKAKPANASSIREATAGYLELMRGQNIIVDSTDERGNVINAYHNIRVTISGDIARIRVEIFPVVGINFQLTEIFLQLPTQAA